MQADIATAAAALKRYQRSGAVVPAVPTPHRLLQDAGSARIEQSLSFTDLDTGGEVRSVAVKATRIRITAGPFETLVSRRHLDPQDTDRNRILAAAGRRFGSLWMQAGLSPIQGQDPGKIRTTAIAAGFLGTDRRCEAYSDLTAARAVLDRRDRIAVEAIVLHDKPLDWTGRHIGSQNDKKLATTLAVHQLRIGLEKLAIHFGLMVAIDPEVLTDEMSALLDAMDRNEATAA